MSFTYKESEGIGVCLDDVCGDVTALARDKARDVRQGGRGASLVDEHRILPHELDTGLDLRCRVP